MKLAFSCPKCRCRNYEEKSIILPEKKKNFIKIGLNTYYAKTCLNCGYTEFYRKSNNAALDILDFFMN